jgi:DNA-binding protein YbaB
MFDGRDLDDAERLVDDWQAGIEARAAAARQLSERLAGLSASARSDDDLVEVTVGASGAVTGLTLDERIRRQPAEGTARSILATMRAAQAALTAAATEVTAETVGTDSATGQAVIASFEARWR